MSRKRAAAPPSRAVSRPLPPADFAEVRFELVFRPAPEIGEWVRSTIIDEAGDLHNPEHRHLADASIGWLWASDGYSKQGRRVLGMTEKLQIMASPWAKGRQEQQFREWFGAVPEFLITLDGFYCGQCSDAEFCALVEHELYHIGHKADEFGGPAFTREGKPKLGIRGHDVEEFVGVVQRYGIGDAGSPLAQMIIAAAKGATVAPIRIAQACGTCMLRAA